MKIILTLILTFNFFSTFGQTTKCNCKKYENRNLNLNCDILFSDNANEFNIEMLKKWEDIKKCDKVKSISFTDFDTIPKAFKRFRNVEKLRIVCINKHNTFGFHYFPKLKELILEETKLIITDSTLWISKIEKLTTNKTELKGIKSFRQFKNLKELNMSFSGFDQFPDDFNSLNQLKFISLVGHTFGSINLIEIDFNKLKQMEYFEVNCWFDKIRGLPLGLNKKVCTKINYEGILKINKKKLNKFTCH